jgi:uncharacterized damage-inducible protein DinB
MPFTPFTLLADYNRWMNQRLYDAAAALSEAQLFEDRGAFFGSLFDTLNHIAVADAIWLRRFAQHADFAWIADDADGLARPTSLRQRLAESLADLRSCRTRTDAVIDRFAAALTDAHLVALLHYTTTAGQPQARRLGPLVQHFFNHQTHHRGQATTLMSQFGVDVGVTDLLALIPNEA